MECHGLEREQLGVTKETPHRLDNSSSWSYLLVPSDGPVKMRSSCQACQAKMRCPRGVSLQRTDDVNPVCVGIIHTLYEGKSGRGVTYRSLS